MVQREQKTAAASRLPNAWPGSLVYRAICHEQTLVLIYSANDTAFLDASKLRCCFCWMLMNTE